MRRWQLWQGPDGHAFFPADDAGARARAEADGLLPTWACEARGFNPAHRQLYAFLGWGDYRPMLRADGTPYPEDEDDGAAGAGA